MNMEQGFGRAEGVPRHTVVGSGDMPAADNAREQVVHELAEARKQAQKLIDRHRLSFELFAESAAPRFIFSDGFYMLFEKKEVHMDTEWFFDRKFSSEQLIWATYHELAHFYDFTEDHRAILGKFEEISQSARETGALFAEKFRQAIPVGEEDAQERYFAQNPIDPKKPERGTMNHFESMAYGIHHEFWNIVDDIYVNSLVAKRKSAYDQEGIFSESVKTLYRDQLFKENDFSKLPRHKQYIYALIRSAMVPDEVISVSDDVREVLSRTLKIGGKEKTASEIVREHIQSRGSIGRKAGARYLDISVTLEPVFRELLLKDIADWEPKIEEEKESGGNESRDAGDDADGDSEGEKSTESSNEEKDDSMNEKSMQEHIDDVFNPSKKKGDEKGSGPSLPRIADSPEDMKKIIEILKEGKEEWSEEKRREEQSKREAEKSEGDIKNELDNLRKKQFAEKWAKEFQMTPDAFARAEREYEDVERSVRPYLASLDALWQRIIYGQSRENITKSVSRFKTGIDIDIDEVVEQYPDIHSGDFDRARVMTRMETVREFVERPEMIRMRFIGDASGSMDDDRREILRQSFVLLFTSLRRFETYLNLSRGRTKSKLTVDTEAWLFGSNVHRIKPFRGKVSRYEEERASIIASFAGLGENHGSTRDDKALVAINESITPDEARRIKAKKIMELVFELTDGGTNEEGIASARKSLLELDEKGVIVRAFQIGTTDRSEQETFGQVWNTDASGRNLSPDRRRGYIVGAEMKRLVPMITAALSEYLGRVEL